MILKNNKEFTEWEKTLKGSEKVLFGANKKKTRKFYLTSAYQGLKLVDKKWVNTFPPSFSLPNSYTTMLGGETVELKYVTRLRGEKEMKPTGEEIVFTNGVLEIRSNQLDLLYFLQNHPRCETNERYFDSKTGKSNDDALSQAITVQGYMVFRERDEVKEKELAFDKKHAIIAAQHLISHQMSKAEVEAAYLAYDSDADISLKEKKMYLMAKAEEDPKAFIETLNGDVRSFKAKINEAIAAEVIYYDREKRMWRWTDNKRELLKVAKGRDEKAELLEHLKSQDDGELLESINAAIAKVEVEVS